MKNEKLKILLVDDEPDALGIMQELLKEFEIVQVVGTAGNRKDAVSGLLKHAPDVIFQDIEMGGKNGLEMVDEYRSLNFSGEIVFVTAYQQYTIDAIRKAAFDYLLKPVDKEELENMILRLLSRHISKTDQDTKNHKRLRVPTRTGFRLVNFAEIVFFEAEGNYTYIQLSDAKKLAVTSHLGKVEGKLEAQPFFRISRSHIINMDYLVSVHKGRNLCVLKAAHEEYELPIAKRRITDLEALI